MSAGSALPGSRPEVARRVLELRKIGRTFGSDPAVEALVDVDLRVYEGDWLSITGPSGARRVVLDLVIESTEGARVPARSSLRVSVNTRDV